MKFKLIVLRLFLVTAVLAVTSSAEEETDLDNDLDMDDDEDFQDSDPDMMDSDMMDPGMDDGSVMDDMDTSDDMSEEEEPKVKRVRPVYEPPVAQGDVHFTDAFLSEEDFSRRWVLSKAKKDDVDEAVSKYDGRWSIEEPDNNPLQNDLGLVLKSQAKHHAVAAMLDKPFTFTGKPFVVQFEVRFQNGQECGGAYIKLLSQQDKLDLTNFQDKTPYTIMFGPDKCGNDHKLHFIFQHKHPLKGTYEEKHASKPKATLDSYFTDKKTHLYTLVVNPNNKFEIYVDQSLVHSGSLLEDMTPAVNPPKEITDPDDKKPSDWDERERIPDSDAVKPDDWDEDEPEMIEDMSAEKPEDWLDDEPELIPDENAEKPSDWDDDTDGEWEPAMISNPKCENAAGCGEWKRPTIKNPKYKGKWVRPTVDNPNYKGKWTPRKIPNPNYFEDLEPYKMTPIAAVGLELWSMSNGILFDNFIITDNKRVADQWAADGWRLKHTEEEATTGGFVQSVVDATHERPWLWAVIIVVIVLPLVLIIVYCCMSTGKDDEVAQRKKTDEPTPDDDADEQEESSATEQDVEPSVDHAEPNIRYPNQSSPKKRSKADLEVKEDDADAETATEQTSADPSDHGDGQ